MEHIIMLRTLIIFITFGSILFAQIPNGNFEQWTSDAPVNWATPNTPLAPQLVSKSTNAFEGSFAAKGVVTRVLPQLLLSPWLQTGDDASGFSYTERPVKMTGNYIFSPLQGDRLSIIVSFFKNDSVVGLGAVTIPTAAAQYTSFEIPITYLLASNPDTCIVTVGVLGPVTGDDYHEGTFFIVDNFQFSNSPTDVQEEVLSPEKFELSQNFPNPFNPSTVISFSVPVSGDVNLSVFNTLGEKVSELVNGTMEAGAHKVEFNATGLPSGLYFYKISSGSFSAIKKMVLLK
jgi:hypothetical protein